MGERVVDPGSMLQVPLSPFSLLSSVLCLESGSRKSEETHSGFRGLPQGKEVRVLLP